MNKVSTYAGSEEESGSEIFKPLSTNAANGRGTKRRKVSLADSDDEYGADVWADSSPPQDSTCIRDSLLSLRLQVPY